MYEYKRGDYVIVRPGWGPDNLQGVVFLVSHVVVSSFLQEALELNLIHMKNLMYYRFAPNALFPAFCETELVL